MYLKRRIAAQAFDRPVPDLIQAKQKGPVHCHVQVHRSFDQPKRGPRDFGSPGPHFAAGESDQSLGRGSCRSAQRRGQEVDVRVASKFARAF